MLEDADERKVTACRRQPADRYRRAGKDDRKPANHPESHSGKRQIVHHQMVRFDNGTDFSGEMCTNGNDPELLNSEIWHTASYSLSAVIDSAWEFFENNGDHF